MKCYGWILGVVCLLPPLCMAQTARLIYSLSSKETAQSQLAHPSKPYNVVTASIAEKLMKLRAYTKTEIFSVTMADTKLSLVFSDEGPYFEIIPGSFRSIPGSMVVGAGKAYASGIERTPGVGDWRPSVYELALDGSNKYHKLFEIQREGEYFAAQPLFISPSGTKIGYEGSMNQKGMIFIHDAVTGKLLQSVDITNLCPDCAYITIDWLADEKRLLLNGTYIVTEDGKVIPAAKSEVPRQAPLHTSFGWKDPQLSLSGRFAAFSEVRNKTQELRPEEHVWGKDLQSGEEKELFMLPARIAPSSEPDVTLNILGWIEK